MTLTEAQERVIAARSAYDHALDERAAAIRQAQVNGLSIRWIAYEMGLPVASIQAALKR